MPNTQSDAYLRTPYDLPEDGSSSSTHLTPEDDSDEELRSLDGQNENGIPMKSMSGHAPSRSPGPDDEEEDEAEEEQEEDDGLTATRVQSFELYTPDEERAVLKKLDRRLVLFVALLYMLSFLDRSNIGNAQLAGMGPNLGLDDSQYHMLIKAFYVTYILFEWMTLLYRILPPHAYIAICVAVWGIVASLQAVSTGFGSMIVCRLLLGIAEAAFGPGVPYYLSFFFRRHELAYRTGLFISAAPLASSFASFLAYGIVSLGGRSGIQPWRLLFLIEGFPSVLVAVWAWFWLPDSPGTARWLTSRQRRIATMRLRRKDEADLHEKRIAGSATRSRFHGLAWREVAKTLADPKSYMTAAMFFSVNVAFSSMPVFEPIIVNAIGYTRLASQGLSSLPHLFAFCVVLLTSRLSDRLRLRSIIVMGAGLSAMCGYILLSLAQPLNLPPIVRYLSLFPITGGFFSAVTLVIVWTLDNQQSVEGKGTGVALLNVIGQVGSLLGGFLYPDSHAPYYAVDHGICAVFMLAVAAVAFGLRIVLRRKNAALGARGVYEMLGRNRGTAHRLDEPEDEDAFVYML